MSGRKVAAMKNSMIGLLGQILSLVLQIISRKVFIVFIGEEILGLNSTFSKILSTLSLAELGVQNAIAFSLYRPLAEKKEQEISEIVNVFKVVYRAIGIFFVVASFALLPFLGFFLKGIELTTDIYLFFLLQAFASSCTYFLAYKRTVLYADQKEYVYKIIDVIMNFIFKLAQIYVIVAWHNYYAYIILQVIQAYGSNIIVHFICKKHYPYLKKEKFNKNYAKTIFSHVKEIFAGRIAGYIYSSTDTLIISKVIGTATVTFVGNYTTVTDNIRYLINSMMVPLTPIIGNFVTENEDIEYQKNRLNIYTHLRYLISLILLVPTVVLIDDFIVMWMEEERFVLSGIIKFLLVLDIYFALFYGACNDFIMAKGLFQKYKIVTIIGCVINLGLSLVLVHTWGIEGILFGTVCGQFYYFIGYSYIAYKYCLAEKWRGYAKFLVQNAYYFASFWLIAVVCNWVYELLPMKASLIKFMCGGVISVGVTIGLYLVMNIGNKEGKELRGLILSMLIKKQR